MMPRLAAVALTAALLAGCAEPDDTVFARPSVAPLEIAPGLFRVTWNAAPDVVRGFSPDGARIVYQSRDLPALGTGWYVLSVGLADGAVREEASVYRQALPDPLGQVVLAASHRILVIWHGVPEGAVTCLTCPPPPTAIAVVLRPLPPEDGIPLSALPARTFNLPNHESVGCQNRIRMGPTERDIQARRVNPYGPVEGPGGSMGVYSDGEAVWRYDPGDTAAPPDSIGPGVGPALSPDGTLLAAAVPVGLDSTSSSCSQGICPCVQETVTITATGWETLLYDLAAGTARPLGQGLEPAFDPLGSRVAVRRPDALYWVDLASGTATRIAGTDGGYAPAISPDGALLAFSAETFGNPDVFFVRLR